jgi:hypothetical protein
MNMKYYLILCLLVSAAVALSILFIPGVAEVIEIKVLTFLSTNAR